MAPEFTQPVTEMSIGRFLGCKARPVLNDNNLNAICEPIVYTMWDP
jgi:hypothetical protein